MNYQWGGEWRCRKCGTNLGSPITSCIDCHWKDQWGFMNEIDQKLFLAASELVEERRKLRDEAKEAAQTIAGLRRELETAKKDIRDLETARTKLFESISRLEGQVDAYKRKLSEVTNLSYEQLRIHIGGVMTKHVDSLVEELKRRMGG